MKLKLQVGKIYKMRNGKGVKITGFRNSAAYPFVGIIDGNDFGSVFAKHGNFHPDFYESEFDLIEEVNTDENERTT